MRYTSAALIACAVAAGCAATPPPKPLPVATIVIDTDHGPHSFRVEVANDHDSQERGLMFRKVMAPDAGMLFDFHNLVQVSFWMKNTILPLDMLFIKPDGTISSIAPNAVPYSEEGIPSAEPIRAVLEINGGRAAALGIEPGGKVHAPIFGDALPGQK
ncbi:MAG TPA: DUF192 domain-containing protein [Rhizomicrobium sp.]|jgi:hypothetical protein|nr:DUF192 domain-containing protein [Rhizomicrobium sp.]